MTRRDTESTWPTMPSLLPRDPSLAGRRLRIDRPVSVLGRDPSSRHRRDPADRVAPPREARVGRRAARRRGPALLRRHVRQRRPRAARAADARRHPAARAVDRVSVGVGTASTPLALAAKRETGEQEVKHLQVLLEMARALNAATVLDEVQEIVLRAAVRIMKADRGSRGALRLDRAAAHGGGGASRPFGRGRDLGRAEHAAREGRQGAPHGVHRRGHLALRSR